jgi:hypothetical protein
MDKSFENKIASKFENFDAPIGSSNWENIKKGLEEPFENKLKSKLNGLPVVVPTSTWAAIESSLPGSLENQLQDKFDNFNPPVSVSIWAGLSQRVESMPGVFEENVRDKFELFEAPPPAAAMQAVFSKLDKKASVNWRKTVASIAAVFLVFSTLLFIPKNTEKYQGFSFNNGNALASFVDKNSIEAKDLANNSTSQPNGFNQKEGKTLESWATQNGEHTVSSNNLQKTYSSGGNNFSGGNSNYAFSAGKNTNNKQSLATLSNSENAIFNIESLPNMELNKLRKGSIGSTLPTLASLGATNSFKIEAPEKGKIDFGISTSNGSFAMKATPNKAIALYDESFSDFQSSLYQTGMYNAVAADLTMAVSQKSKLITGLNITSARNAMTFDIYPKDKPSSYNSLTDNGTIVTNYYNPQSNRLSSKKDESLAEYAIVDQKEISGDSITNGNKFKMSNKYLFVDIPVGFQFELAQRGKTSISARIGSKIRLIAGANSYHLTSDKRNIIEVSPAMSQAFYQTSLVGFAGLSLNKEVNNDYELFIGPEVNLNLTDLNRMGTWMSMRPFQLGVNVGIRHKVS